MAKKNKSESAKLNSNSFLLSENSSFSVQEAYKTLRTNISFSLPGKKCKCIGVTSANRGDGKSSVAVNLAISYAQINKKVIIVDCDMRLPTVAAKIGIENKPGLSDYLVDAGNGEDLRISRVQDKGVDVMPAGSIPPDPTTLLESEQMANLIDVLKRYYDYIIIDLPPLMPVSDAVILTKYIDGYLIVVRHNSSEYGKIDETLHQLKFADAKVIGFVYNGKVFESHYRKSGRYYYYYDYYKKSSKSKNKSKRG